MPEDPTKDASLAVRWEHRQNCLLPKCFQDILPQAQPSLPPQNPPSPPATPSGESQTALGHTLASATCKILHTPQNLFGLVCQYYAEKFPSVDPEEEVTLAQLSDYPITSAINEASPGVNFLPFHNKNSFHLGYWYWTGGVQKSVQSFKDLIDIVGNADFHPDDVCQTKLIGY